MTDRFVTCDESGKPLHVFIAKAMPLLRSIAVWVALACAVPVQAYGSRVPFLQELAPGVYAVVGENSEPAVENRGVVGNQGIIVGEEGVIVIDTGTSARYAQDLVAAIGRLTAKPIVLAINTHQNPAFVFGNGTLALQGVPILAHHDVAGLIAQRCHKCLKKLNSILGAEEMSGTKVTVPTRTLDGDTTIEVAGRQLDIIHYGRSSSPGSIGVIDRKSGILFAGGLVSIDRIPDAKDAHIPTWLAALEDIKIRKPILVVPGEGPVSSLDDLDNLSSYLTALESVVKQTFQAGISLGMAAESSQLPRFEQWLMYDTVHKKNVEQQYLQLERRALDGQLFERNAKPIPGCSHVQ